MGTRSLRSLLVFVAMLLGTLAGSLIAENALAASTGESCFFSSCDSANDYCAFGSFICTRRPNAGQSCSAIFGPSCLPGRGLVCDAIGECRHSPPRNGQPCGVGVPCASGLACNSPVAGRCRPQGAAGQTCIGIGRGSCQAGLVCDATFECRHPKPELGEPCGVGVPCAAGLACNSPVAGRCEEQGQALESCIGIGRGSCAAGLVCDFLGECRHSPPQAGEYCGTGVPCISSLGCSQEIAGRCEERDGSGETCSGFGQGSCEDGLVCDALRECRHPTPELNELCGAGVSCAAGLYCQAGIPQRCKTLRTLGEGCSAFNPCGSGLSCQPCLVSGCNAPLQCFNNANDGAISEESCVAIHSPALQAEALRSGVTTAYGGGISFAKPIVDGQPVVAGGVGTRQIGAVYGGNGNYGCFDTACEGIESDIALSGYGAVGIYTSFDVVEGCSTATVQEASTPTLIEAGISTSQIFSRDCNEFLQFGGLIGNESAFTIGISANPLPLTLGVFSCETTVDLVNPLCGDGAIDTANGEACDDGNRFDGDGCSGRCAVESMCGNGELDMGEDCDDGNLLGGDGCTLCAIDPFCGNGQLDMGEACDDGGLANGDGCSELCEIESICGNTLVEPGELCDDGNSSDGDGCSSQCEPEPVTMTGDIDGDLDVDRDDVNFLLGFRNAPAADCPACDLNGDGRINGSDARVAVTMCSQPRCARVP